MVNLIDAPELQDTIEAYREKLSTWMHETDDYLVDAFAARNDRQKLQDIFLQLDADALKRSETLQWKRYKNRAGGTGKNTLLYVK